MSGATDLTALTAAELSEQLGSGAVSAVEVTEAHLGRIAEVDGAVHAYLTVAADEALATARDVDAQRAAGDELHPLAGVPIALKDNVVTRGLKTTCASRMLANWVPPYDATIVTRLRQAGMPILGKTNLDEFAMGSSTEHSAFGPSRNPWDLERIPGGSGGGSAAALAAFTAPLAVGTDTGGSIRQPAAVTGTVGVKPTYGGVSRYGIVSLASSLDQAGPAARTVLDAALLHEVLGGHDRHDATSLPNPLPPVVAAALEGATGDLRGVRVGVISELTGDGYQEGVRLRFAEGLDLLRQAGADVVEVSCAYVSHALAAYYVLLPSEASSNLARFDALRFGEQVEPDDGRPVTVDTVMSTSRAAGFGDEVKRRTILGTYALSAGHYDAYYTSAQKVRTLVQRDFERAFASVDVLVSPTAPTTAFKIGEKDTDPLAMYLNDVATIPANLAGLPAMSLPAGLAEDGLPVGIQIMAPALADDRLYRVGAALEAALVARWGAPLLTRTPDLSAAAIEEQKAGR